MGAFNEVVFILHEGQPWTISTSIHYMYHIRQNWRCTERVQKFYNSQCSKKYKNEEWMIWFLFIDLWCFNATFHNISAISWQPVLVVEEAGVPRENRRSWELVNFITCDCESSHLFSNLQSRARTHAVLVIGLY